MRLLVVMSTTLMCCKFDLLFGDFIYNKIILCVHLFIAGMEFWILTKGMTLWLFE